MISHSQLAPPNLKNRYFMYKFIRSDYASLMRLYGHIRIGTLHDFRRTEHAQGISDPKEGKKSVNHKIEKLVVGPSNWDAQQNNPDFQALSKLGNIEVQQGAHLFMFGTGIQRTIDSEDCFIYCLSHKYSIDMYSLFDDANTCLEITDPVKFFACITEELTKICPVNFEGFHKVKYQKREEKWNGNDLGLDPILIKEDEPKYRDQQELRALWKTPPERPIGVEFIICK